MNKTYTSPNKSRSSSTGVIAFFSVTSVCLLTACGGGGGAGDSTNESSAIENASTIAVAPLVGTWNLPDDWNGLANDEAYLQIRSPSTNGTAVTIVYDFDDAATGLGQNCFRQEGLPGEISQSLSNELFLDHSVFPNGIVSLNAAGNLIIEFSEDASSSLDRETTTLISERLNITETDITPLCSN